MRARRPQRPLWASTGTKDPSYSDVLYVERLIAAGVINTMPENTLRAFADHGTVELTLGGDIEAARSVLSAAAGEGVDLDAITSELEREGVQAFCDSYASCSLHRRQAQLLAHWSPDSAVRTERPSRASSRAPGHGGDVERRVAV